MRLFKLTVILILLLAAGCSTGIVVHNEARAAELIIDFLTALKSTEGIEQAYAWTDDRFKQEISADEFRRIVARLRNQNLGAEIRLNGYEVFGPVELFNVYASSSPEQGKLYFRFVLTGSNATDYYLLKLDVSESGFSREGTYRAYRDALSIDGL